MKPIGYKTYLLVVVSMLLMIMALPMNAEAESGTDTIQEDYYKAHSVSFFDGDSIEISYTMEVTDGPNIDVFFLDSDNYQYMQDGQEFEYSVVGSDLNTRYTTKTITLYEHDTYYIVFDNTDIETDPPWNMVDDTAYVSWTIDSDITYPESDDDDNSSSTPGFEIAFLLGAIFVCILYLRRRKYA